MPVIIVIAAIHCSQHCLQSLSYMVLEVFVTDCAKAFGPEPGSIQVQFPS